MIQTWKTILGISIVLALTACAENAEDTSPPEKVVHTYTLNGETPQDFYNRFLFKTQGECAKENVTYIYPRSDSVTIRVDSHGNDIRASISILMKSDQTYRAIYREDTVISFSAGISFAFESQSKVLQGVWSVEKDKLVFDRFGSSMGILHDDRPAIRIRFPKDIISPGISGRTVLLTSGTSLQAPFPDLNPCDL